MQASASEISWITDSGYDLKSSMIITFAFECEDRFSIGRRERRMREVMDVLSRHWIRISPPMKPVAPVRMTFISSIACTMPSYSQAVKIRKSNVSCEFPQIFSTCSLWKFSGNFAPG